MKRAIKPRRRPWLIALVSVLVVLLGAGTFYAVQTGQLLFGLSNGVDLRGDLTPDVDDVTDPDLQIEEGSADGQALDAGRPEAGAEGTLNYLLLGADARGDSENGRSDVIMLAHVPATRDKVYLISFTRDMWVTIPERGSAKINAAYAYGGPALAVRTVENLIETRIDHVVTVDFEGFAALTEAVGGVEVINEHASKSWSRDRSEQFTYPKGRITLSGESALSYVRDRKGLPEGDLDRAERQRLVLSALLAKMAKPEVLANPVAFSNMTTTLGRHLTADQGLTPAEIWNTATSMRISGSDVVSLQAPLAGFGRSKGGQAINLVDWNKMSEMAQHIHAGTMDQYQD